MHTELHPDLINNSKAQAAKNIIEACVHCGFCTATCPTYQHYNDERDGPRGRIYLIKQLLENNDVTEKTQTHLDRCLTCRSCETTCPSGVQYGRLIDIGKGMVEEKVPRGCSSDDLVCTQIMEEADGTCGRSESDPCRFQDPDCSDGQQCPAIALAPDGICDGPVNFAGCDVPDPDCESACPEKAQASDGVCGGDIVEDGCVYPDPDCPSECDAICHVGQAYIPCADVLPECAGHTEPGEPGDGTDTVCAQYLEEADGVCSRSDDDPCRSQDPDCS